MKPSADLLDRLSYSPARNAKLRLMADYFRTAPDPDRGWALCALTDGLPFSFPLRRTLTDMMARRMDPELFRLSRDYVGDTAETIALVWDPPRPSPRPSRERVQVRAAAERQRSDLPSPSLSPQAEEGTLRRGRTSPASPTSSPNSP